MTFFLKVFSFVVLVLVGFTILTDLANAISQEDDITEIFGFPWIDTPDPQFRFKCAGLSQENGQSVCPTPSTDAPHLKFYKCCHKSNDDSKAICCAGGASPDKECPADYARTRNCGVPT